MPKSRGSPENTPKPEFSYRYSRYQTLEANGELATRRAFYVALIIAFGKSVIWPIVLLIAVWHMPDKASLAPLLRQGLSHFTDHPSHNPQDRSEIFSNALPSSDATNPLMIASVRSGCSR